MHMPGATHVIIDHTIKAAYEVKNLTVEDSLSQSWFVADYIAPGGGLEQRGSWFVEYCSLVKL